MVIVFYLENSYMVCGIPTYNKWLVELYDYKYSYRLFTIISFLLGIKPNERYQSYSPWGIEMELPPVNSALWDLLGPVTQTRVWGRERVEYNMIQSKRVFDGCPQIKTASFLDQ